MKARVLVVDDSAVARHVLRAELSKDPGLEVVGMARDPYEARDLLVRLRPDVITLDLEMPRMDGITFLEKYMKVLPTPTVLISALADRARAIRALQAGAVDVVAKPSGLSAADNDAAFDALRTAVRTAATVDVQAWMSGAPDLARADASAPARPGRRDDLVVAIGASTGGVAALASILGELPASTPGIVLVQHMPIGFTASLAQRLDELSALDVVEAQPGDEVRPGRVLLAPAHDRHMRLVRRGAGWCVEMVFGELACHQRPAADVLFSSVARAAGASALGMILTGMGEDGARGLLEMRQAGATTVGQDAATSVVYGMPQAAHRLGAVEEQLPLSRMAERITRFAASHTLRRSYTP